jgi:pimeloyl-ACP methyl ester carboxylesterase
MTPSVVFLHGWGGSSASTWADWPENFAARDRKVLMIDLPGHDRGASHNPKDYADLAGVIAERLPTGTLDVVAYSLGAKVALAIAAHDPARFGRLVLGGIGDNAFAPEPDASVLAAALVNGISANTPAPIAGLVRYAQAGGGDPAALAAVLQRPRNPVIAEADLAKIANVLLINGSDDRIALPDQRLRTALHDPEYLLLPGVDHLSLPKQQAFRDAAADFLN